MRRKIWRMSISPSSAPLSQSRRRGQSCSATRAARQRRRFLSQPLIVLLDPADIVVNLHHAYRRPEFRDRQLRRLPYRPLRRRTSRASSSMAPRACARSPSCRSHERETRKTMRPRPYRRRRLAASVVALTLRSLRPRGKPGPRARSFPANRVKCRYFRPLWPIIGKAVLKSPTIRVDSTKIPYAAEQGINSDE